MRNNLTTIEIKSLLWIHKKRSVYSFKHGDPDITDIRELVKKRLVRANVVIRHPVMLNMFVTQFRITRKGVRYAKKLIEIKQEKRNG